MNWFHQALRFSLFGGDGGLCSGEIMEGGGWVEACAGRGLMVRGVAVEAEVRLLGCWVTLDDGVCVGICVCPGVWSATLSV